MTELRVLKVFTGPDGRGGNPLGVLLDGPPAGSDSYYAWAWIDEAAGILRSRYFVPSLGIGEDEATGAAAVVMGGALGRPLEIHQGVGSLLHVRPGPDGTIEVGGVVDEVDTRELAV
jgi:predicted PhzF superfamily epimerase YddE/YHI9